MSIVWFLLTGLVVGWLAGVLIRGRGYGVVADIVIGVIGGVVGGLLFGVVGVFPRSTIGDILMSLIGAIVFLAIVKAIHKAA